MRRLRIWLACRRLNRDDWGTRDTPRFRSYCRPDVSALRQLHKHWTEREFSALDRSFAITRVWNQTRANEVLGAETPDALIERLIAAAAEERRAA